MQLHQKLLALSLVSSVLLPLILVPVPTLAQSRGCTDCGVVASVNLIRVGDAGRTPDTLVGGVAAALLNSPASHDRTPEAGSGTSNHFEVVLRLPGGATQTVTYATEPGFKPGDTVQVTDGVLTHQP